MTVIPGGGAEKSECIRLRQSLGEAVATFTDRLSTVALLDRDLGAAASVDGVYYLPVGMIENLLLDPDAIWEAIQSVMENTRLVTVDDVNATLTRILDAAEDSEAERRALNELGYPLLSTGSTCRRGSRQAAAAAADITVSFSTSV